MYLKNYCDLKIVRLDDTTKITKLVNGNSSLIKVVNIAITDKDSEINSNSNGLGSQIIGSKSAPDITETIGKQKVILDHKNRKFIKNNNFLNLFKPGRRINLCKKTGSYGGIKTETIDLPSTINLSTLRLNLDFTFRDQGWGNYTNLKIIMYNNGKRVTIYGGSSHKPKRANMSIDLSQKNSVLNLVTC